MQLKNEHKELNPTELALLTWYSPDNPLYKNPEHPTIKLAGEIGELLDLWAKNKYKPRFDWMTCKCGHSYDYHLWINGLGDCEKCLCDTYTSLVLDELGDVWYYLRILAWMSDTIFILPDDWYFYSSDDCIKQMYQYASNLLYGHLDEYEPALQEIYYYLNVLLANLEYALEDLTLLNYYKLNSEPTNHGWKDAR